MFVYKFKSPNSLLSYISVSGQYMTLWQRKDYGAELSIFVGDYNADVQMVRFVEDPRHELFHNKSSLSPEHMHIIFNKKLNEKAFKQFVKKLESASSKENREKSYASLMVKMNEDRIKAGDDKFPSYVQEVIDKFDKTTPLIPVAESEQAINAFEKYCANRKQPKLIFQEHCEQLTQCFSEYSWHLSKQIDTAPESEEDIVNGANTFDEILRELRVNAVLTTSYSIARIEEKITRLQNNKTMMEAFNQKLKRDYPTPLLSRSLIDLKNDLKVIKTLIQGTRYKRILNMLSVPVALAATIMGFGALTVTMAAAATWMLADTMNRTRDWYKFSSYQKDITSKKRLTVDEKVSSEMGKQAATSFGKQFLSLFKPAAWQCSQRYYAALAKQQIDDQTKPDIKGLKASI